jgi:hypothetical protein
MMIQDLESREVKGGDDEPMSKFCCELLRLLN